MNPCTDACWSAPDCTVCKMRKAPRGRSIAVAASNGMCSSDCPGYDQEPKPGHFWPGEEIHPPYVDGRTA